MAPRIIKVSNNASEEAHYTTGQELTFGHKISKETFQITSSERKTLQCPATGEILIYYLFGITPVKKTANPKGLNFFAAIGKNRKIFGETPAAVIMSVAKRCQTVKHR